MRAPRLRPGDRWEIPLGPWEAGINEKVLPSLLGSDELKGAANMLFDEIPGAATKRLGSQVIVALPSGNPPKFDFVFKKTDGTEYWLLSDGVTLYVTTNATTFTQLITGLDSTAFLQFDTAENKCWITNGSNYVMWYDGSVLVLMDRTADGTTDALTDITHIVDSERTEADDYWNNRVVVITSGTYAGMEGRCTDFDAATDTMTISGFTAAPGVGVTYSVGVEIPKGKIIRFCNGTLLMGDTVANRSEIRFNRLDDPDTGEQQSIDNPRAWPATHQIAITQDDGDHLYSFSPVYRNRVVVSKGNALYRLEPDATYVWAPYLISRDVGCKYPDCWVIKNELLYFVGSERSGLLDMYATDLTGVKPVHKDGRFIPEFNNIQRGSASYHYLSRSSAAEFDTGTKSTLCKTVGNRLESRVIDIDSDWNEVISSKTNLCVGDSADGGLNIIGLPPWTAKYKAKVLPAADTPVWSTWNYVAGGEAIVGEALRLYFNFAGWLYHYKNAVYNSAKNTFVAFRVGAAALVTSFEPIVTVQNGVKRIQVRFTGGRILVNDVDVAACDIVTAWKCVSVLLDKNGNGAVYVAGVRVWTGTAAAAAAYLTYWTTNSIVFGAQETGNYGAAYAYYDYVYEDNDYLYTAAELYTACGSSVNLPSTGNAVIKIDYTRTPPAYGKYFLQRVEAASGTTGAGTTNAQIVDATRTEADDHWNGATVIITTGTGAALEGRVTDFDSATHTLTISGFTGDPGAGVKYQILEDDGTVLIQTASSPDDINISGYSTLENGHEPGVDNATPIERYLYVKITLTRASWEGFTNYAMGPVIETLTGGFLWRMTAQEIGPLISAWRNWQATTYAPTGGVILQQARIAKTVAAPTVEGDYEALATIVDGNNIGTVLTDTVLPPTGEGRWLDAIITGGPGPDGTTSYLDVFTANWQEGSGAALVVAGFIYKKRLYLTAISSTGTHNDLLFVLDTRNAWTIFTGVDIFKMSTFKGLIYGLSSSNANIYQMEVAGLYTDAGVAITGTIDTGEINFGHTEVMLEYVKLGVNVAGTYKIYLSYDGITYTLKGTLVFTEQDTQRLWIPSGQFGKRHYIRVTSESAEAAGVILLAAGFKAVAEE